MQQPFYPHTDYLLTLLPPPTSTTHPEAKQQLVHTCSFFALDLPEEIQDLDRICRIASTTEASGFFVHRFSTMQDKVLLRRAITKHARDAADKGCKEQDFLPALWARIMQAKRMD